MVRRKIIVGVIICILLVIITPSIGTETLQVGQYYKVDYENK